MNVEQNERLTRITPGKLCSQLLRQYWSMSSTLHWIRAWLRAGVIQTSVGQQGLAARFAPPPTMVTTTFSLSRSRRDRPRGARQLGSDAHSHLRSERPRHAHQPYLKYRLTSMNKTISVHFTAHSGATTSVEVKIGKSLMEAATSANVDGIAADCGGLMTCATCHVYVDEPFASQLGAPDAEEAAMLAFTAGPRQSNSRLSCQITLSSALNGLTVKLPSTQY